MVSILFIRNFRNLERLEADADDELLLDVLRMIPDEMPAVKRIILEFEYDFYQDNKDEIEALVARLEEERGAVIDVDCAPPMGDDFDGEDFVALHLDGESDGESEEEFAFSPGSADTLFTQNSFDPFDDEEFEGEWSDDEDEDSDEIE